MLDSENNLITSVPGSEATLSLKDATGCIVRHTDTDLDYRMHKAASLKKVVTYLSRDSPELNIVGKYEFSYIIDAASGLVTSNQQLFTDRTYNIPDSSVRTSTGIY